MVSRKEILAAITAVLSLQSPLSAREIASLLAASGVPVDKSRVNKTLYAERSTFRHSADVPPFWSLAGKPAPFPPPPISPTTDWLPSLDLYGWQRRALDGWAKHGHRGVIEAVTGAGKTRLALAAIASEVARGGKAVDDNIFPDRQGRCGIVIATWRRCIIIRRSRRGRIAGIADHTVITIKHDWILDVGHRDAGISYVLDQPALSRIGLQTQPGSRAVKRAILNQHAIKAGISLATDR